MKKYLFLLLIIFSPLILNAELKKTNSQLNGEGKKLLAHFNEPSNPTVYDLSGSGRRGTLENGALRIHGQYGNKIQCDGINDWVNFGDDDYFHGWDQLTAGAWIKTTGFSGGTQRGAVFKYGAGDTYSFTFGYGPTSFGANKIGISLRTSVTWGGVVASGTYSLGTEYHIVVAYDGSNIKIYINGEFDGIASLTGTVRDTAPSLYVGYNQRDNTYTACEVDELFFDDRAYEAGEVRAIYEKQLKARQ